MENPLLLALFFFLIAIFYSSVGFGGGSSYLALLVLAGVDLFVLRSTALMCNIIVVSGGTYIFYQEGYLNIRRTLPLVLASVPFAFIGGYLPLSSKFIFITLGFTLLLASVMLWVKPTHNEQHSVVERTGAVAAVVGGVIGLVSGMVGIGGGIFLSPVLNLMNWNKAKKIAAIASLFILVNSIAGLVGQWMQHPPYLDLNWSWPLLIAVLLGGQIGSRLAVLKFSNTTVQRTTAVLILIASLKILNDHLFGF
ncbi:sulfite exporter TauE/SafE family protein [Fulvivirga lutimaris]|uniref:sulfite exporter TauE/SafE family protein n=1 Tax=Fulvivirga lutimaris TaxID=1819566 RepID=UPI0012BB554D|nr:sulfite exporter TauE/SafE family protein [Fulvivirga lutimaris]MTI38795.1 sulfite exporter TauE/SafE family protein [Fulvivirga lutimaris]